MPSLEESCPNCEEECTCWRCENCDTWCNPEDNVSCGNCERCEGCCACWYCEGCCESQSEHDTRCNLCERCESCCTCWHCAGCGELTSERYSPCSICDKCENCCSCPKCGGCGECFTESSGCIDCSQCSSCGCTCDMSSPVCETCHRRHCMCLTCNHINPDTGIIDNSHRFNPASTPLCHICYTCQEHCTKYQCQNCNSRQHNLCNNCKRCALCCHCVFCHIYGGRHVVESQDALCVPCARCALHCCCPVCKTCQKKGGSTCKWCGECRTCCDGASSKCGAGGRSVPIPQRKPSLVLHIPTKLQRKRLPNPRLIGPEIEVNNIRNLGASKMLHEALNKWYDAVVKDGSIGDQPKAFEINVSPSAGDLFLDHIKNLTDGLAKMDARPDKECGLHIHIDASDFGVYDLHSVISLYAKVEKALYNLCHPTRLWNNYAVVCGKFYLDAALKTPSEFRSALTGKLYGNSTDNPLSLESVTCRASNRYSYASSSFDKLPKREQQIRIAQQFKQDATKIKDLKKEKYHQLRYKALNLHSYFLRKTIEFRHHEGTIDYEDITGWAMVCQQLISAANTLPIRSIESLPRNSRRALLEIMPDRLHHYIFSAWHRNDLLLGENERWKDRHTGVWNGTIDVEDLND